MKISTVRQSRRRSNRRQSRRRSNRRQSRRRSNRRQSRRRPNRRQSRRRSNRRQSRRRSNRRQSRRKINRSRRYSRAANDSNKEEPPNSKPPKKKMSTGAKVALGVGGTYVAGKVGVQVLAHHLWHNSQQAQEIAKIGAEKAGSQEEAVAVREHLQNEIERLNKVDANDKTVPTLKKLLQSDNATAGVQKIHYLEAQQKKAMKDGRSEDAEKLAEQIKTMNTRMGKELTEIDGLKDRKSIEEYVDKRKSALQDEIDKINLKLKDMPAKEVTDAQFDEAAKEVDSSTVTKKVGEDAGLEAEESAGSFLAEHALL